MNTTNLEGKVEKLNSILKDLGKAVIAFSGGVDSAFLAAGAFRVLGDNAQKNQEAGK